MSSHAVVVVLAFVALTAIGRAADASAPTLDAARIESLVAHLASSDFDTRDIAARELAACPARCLPLLRKLSNASADPEVKCRLFTIARTLITDRVVLRLPDAKPRTRVDFVDVVDAAFQAEHQEEGPLKVKRRVEEPEDYDKRILALRDYWAEKFWNGWDIPDDALNETAQVHRRSDTVAAVHEEDHFETIIIEDGKIQFGWMEEWSNPELRPLGR